MEERGIEGMAYMIVSKAVDFILSWKLRYRPYC